MRTLTAPWDTGQTWAAATEHSQWDQTGHRGLGSAAVSWAPTRYKTSRGPSKKGPELISVFITNVFMCVFHQRLPILQNSNVRVIKGRVYFNQKAVSSPLVDDQYLLRWA